MPIIIKNTFGINKEKPRVTAMFDAIAYRYNLLNAILSFGMVGLWRKYFVSEIKKYMQKQNKNDFRILDLATGTGKNVLHMHRLKPLEIVGIDLSGEMLAIAREMARKKQLSNTAFMPGDAENIPFGNEHFDIVTTCFGIRNFQNDEKAFSETFRTLNPGGAFFIMEFSTKHPVIFYPFIAFYLKFIIPLVGKIISKNNHAYAYLSGTIDAYDTPNEVIKKLQQQGFYKTENISLCMGVVTIFKCIKPY